MINDPRFQEAIDRIDAANAEDPRRETVDGVEEPRELLFARRVYAWVFELIKNPSEELLLAARSHTIRRWAIPRSDFPKTTQGYHAWRGALAAFHADAAATILSDVDYTAEQVQRVRDFITKANWPGDKEACVLEDAGCLVFIETKLENYLDEWDEIKAVRILARTLQKMTSAGRERVLELNVNQRVRKLLIEATPKH